MLPALTVRDWARRLFAYEDVAGIVSQARGSAIVRVYEKLRARLTVPIGSAAFQTLASRALTLASSEVPELSHLKVLSDGRLEGLNLSAATEKDQHGEAGVVLIAHVLDLVLTLLGEATTRSLVLDLRHQAVVAPDQSKSPDASEPTEAASASGQRTSGEAFAPVLTEVDRLRSVSEALETLADKHPDMAEGLISVAGNLRNIATVLDIFVLLRTKDDDSQIDEPNPCLGYLM